MIKEVERIPEDKLDFRAAAETRSAIELLYHVIESERMLVDEICRDDTDLRASLDKWIGTDLEPIQVAARLLSHLAIATRLMPALPPAERLRQLIASGGTAPEGRRAEHEREDDAAGDHERVDCELGAQVVGGRERERLVGVRQR